MRRGIVAGVIFLITSACCFAAGGTCPSGANYLNPTTGALVTLSSLGITSCYYVAANGSDSNDGLSEATGHPWLHAPQMPNCSSNCATVQNAFNGPPAGTGFIFRGGDTWHFGASTSPSTGGQWTTGNNLNGTQTNPYYYGVDQSWYSGSSWARPILTGDNPVCGSPLTSGCTQGSLSTYTVKQYYVSSCDYQIGSANQMVAFAGSSHHIFDNFELTGVCQSAVGQPANHDEYINYGSSGDMRFFNLYIHGWTHAHYADVNGGGNCNSGNVCFGISIFAGGSNQTPDDTLRYVVVDGSDSDPIAAQACYCDWNDVAYSYFGNQSNAIVRFPHLFHDNLYEYWYENGHGNVLESVGDETGTNAFYNNVFRHINTLGDPGDPLLWLLPATGTTDYFFNDLIYDVGTMEYFIAGNNNSNQGAYILFNSTLQSNYSGNGISCSATGNSSSLYLANNYYVSDGSGFTITSSSNCSPRLMMQQTNLTMTNSTATSDSYSSSETYAYSPTSGSSPTVGAGTNEGSINSAFCSALGSAGLSAAATACASATTYACTYSTSNHAMTCPALTATARPPSGAWDVGAYQGSSTTTGAPPSAPTSLSTTAQ